MKKDKLYTVNKWNQPMLGGKNLFWPGGELNTNLQLAPTFANVQTPTNLTLNPNLLENIQLKQMLGNGNSGVTGKSIGSKNGWIGGATAAGGEFLQNFLSNGYSAGTGFNTAMSTVRNINTGDPLIDGIKNAAATAVQTLGNLGWGTKENKGNINTLEQNAAQANMAGNALASSTTSSDFFNNSGMMTTGTGFGTTDLVKGGWFAKGKARRKGQKYLDKEANALAMQNQGMVTGANNVDSYMDDAIMSNFAAFGGPIGLGTIDGALGIMQADKYINAINNRTNALAKNNAAPQDSGFTALTTNRFGDGGEIHIKPENKGKFTAKAKKAGMGVQEYASHVLGNKEDYPTSTVRQANFARNAAGWKHAGGGGLEGAFLDNFSKDPIQAALAYTQSLDALDAERAAQAEALAQQQALEDMQLKLANAETQRQGLQALIDNQAMDIKNLQDAQALQAVDNSNWQESMQESTDDMLGTLYNTMGKAIDKNKGWDYIERQLKKSGKFNDIQIAGIKLNTNRESGFNPNAVGDGGKAKGLLQWHPDRQPTDMSMTGQIEHMINTLSNYDGNSHWIGRSNYEGFLNARTPEEAHYYIAKGYERPRADITERLRKVSDMSLRRKRAFGGELGTNGTDFTNGLLEINTGSSHEDNPHQGVQLGVDANGVPNLVEEGETVYNDYVFSNRMTVPAFMKKQLGLGGSMKKDITFADASKKLAEVAKERPTNPIDQAGLDASLGKLAQVQEAERARMQAKQDNQAMQEYLSSPMAAYGGTIRRQYPDGGYLWDEFWKTTNPTSKLPGNPANKYKIDTSYKGDVKAREAEDDYIAFTDYILNRATPEERLNYFRWIDENTGRSAGKYLDANGNLIDGWDDAYVDARNDGLWGIQHYTPTFVSNTAPEVVINGNARNAGRTFHAVEGDDDYLPEDQSKWVGVGPQTGDPVKLDNGDTVIYHSRASQNPAFTEDELQAAANKIRGLSKDEFNPLPTWMRYAPIAGAGIMALTDALGLTNKPDYTYANKLEAAANRAGYAPNIQPRFIGDYLKYQPMDIWAEQNRLNANTRATDRALINNSAPIGTRAAGLLANEYNNQIGSGELYRKALEYNDANRQQVANFNRGTNMFNAQMGMQADEANARYRQAANHYVMSGLAQAAALRDSIDQRVGASRSANITNFLTSLGNLGRENFAMNQINSDRSRRHGVGTNGVSYDKIARANNVTAFGGAVEKYQKNKKKGRR